MTSYQLPPGGQAPPPYVQHVSHPGHYPIHRIVVLKPINHFGHAVATLFTGGLWGFVWLGVVLNRKFQR